MAVFVVLSVVVFGLEIAIVRLVRAVKGRGHPVLAALRLNGIKPGPAEYLLCKRQVWESAETLMTAREQHFLRRLSQQVDERRWRLCPQVRVADIARITPDIPERSATWWQLFRMASQWHCDVVIVDRESFRIVAAVELDDASHLKQRRVRRDILLEEVLRQAGIPLISDRNLTQLIRQVSGHLAAKAAKNESASMGKC
ncbi:DUF2726 domain-containing protein [Lelliottia nimipressuralis]|uniref:DUF2726 domain-containing protein n=1 Tax=Lelliottia nimipressuralis TaxID=69220 RepID=A0ABY3NXM9_9ENTR|nr:DUF2726 domain-containing protein [Lelliottia nimipressuralis]TYT29282.1 DUF2726 domain-containing protein [Lelliottia nimipressuralis]